MAGFAGRTRGRDCWSVARGARAVVALCSLASFLASSLPATPVWGFGLDDVSAVARELASKDFVGPRDEVPEWLLRISYDQWRDIRFRPEKSLWRDAGSSFEVQFFHPGLFYDRAVRINEIDAEGVHPIDFSPSDFNYGDNDFAAKIPQDLGFAGFRLHYPVKTASYKDEVVVFLGASYFRAVGRDLGFGLSARALAVDTGLSSGEEFPFFKEFWLERPRRGAAEAVVYALIDSPSLTGAYRFVVYPGVRTLVEVQGRLFRREPVKQLGIAPLTSMFYHGENTVRGFEDFRPEVHDSDGLLIADREGKWNWRPLDNPERLSLNYFALDNPIGFGLLQRDRNFDHYQDLETRPDLRPSVWVRPQGDWGNGHVVLVQIPTRADVNDNIVAFWVPADLPPPDKPVEFSYRMAWYGDDPELSPGGRAVATFRDRAGDNNGYRFIVDFAGKALSAIPADAVLRADVSVSAEGRPAGEIVESQVEKNVVTGGWRLSFTVQPDRNDAVELRAFLDRSGKAISETWTYTLQQ